MMLYTKTTAYAIRAITYLACRHPRFCTVHQISTANDIPNYYLSQILKRMPESGLIKSRKGRGGGFKLGRQPDEITLYHIKVALEGTSDFVMCAVGPENCSAINPCPLHQYFSPIHSTLIDKLKQTTIADLALIYADSLTLNGDELGHALVSKENTAPPY